MVLLQFCQTHNRDMNREGKLFSLLLQKVCVWDNFVLRFTPAIWWVTQALVYHHQHQHAVRIPSIIWNHQLSQSSGAAVQCGKHQVCMSKFANYHLNYWMHEYHEYAAVATISPSFQVLRRFVTILWYEQRLEELTKRAEFFNFSFRCNERHSCGSDRCTHPVLWSVPPPNLLDFKAAVTKMWIYSSAFNQSVWQEQS